jgi:hypothetical protein
MFLSTYIYIYDYYSILQKILYFPSKKFGLWKNILKQFAENKIISVEATNIEHVIKCETI